MPLPAAIKSYGPSAHPQTLLYVYYTVSFAAQFPAFLDFYKGLLTCLQDIAKVQ
jgi:hypothetical protein